MIEMRKELIEKANNITIKEFKTREQAIAYRNKLIKAIEEEERKLQEKIDLLKDEKIELDLVKMTLEWYLR